MKEKWYKTNWGVILLLFIFYPLGLYFMWRNTSWKPKVKWGITTIFALLFFGYGMLATSKPAPVPNTTATSNTSTTNNIPTSTPAPTATSIPVEKMNIVVTSQIVKRVGGKHRYFFDIRNKDTKPFEGSVTISLFTDNLKNPIAGDTFDTTRAIEPELGTSVYADANTGPTSVHGENGITKFKYTVKKGDQVVNTGEGTISEKFENLDF